MMSNSMEEISSAIDYNGDNLVKIKPFQRIPEFAGPTIALCSLNLAVEILKSKNYPGVYCNLDNFKCTNMRKSKVSPWMSVILRKKS